MDPTITCVLYATAGGEHVGVEASLGPREHRRLKALCERLRTHEDDAAARHVQGLVGGAGDDIGVRHRRGVRAGGDEPGDTSVPPRASIRAERGHCNPPRSTAGPDHSASR